MDHVFDLTLTTARHLQELCTMLGAARLSNGLGWLAAALMSVALGVASVHAVKLDETR